MMMMMMVKAIMMTVFIMVTIKPPMATVHHNNKLTLESLWGDSMAKLLGTGLEIHQSRAQVPLWPPAGFVPDSPWCNSSAGLVHI